MLVGESKPCRHRERELVCEITNLVKSVEKINLVIFFDSLYWVFHLFFVSSTILETNKTEEMYV